MVVNKRQLRRHSVGIICFVFLALLFIVRYHSQVERILQKFRGNIESNDVTVEKISPRESSKKSSFKHIPIGMKNDERGKEKHIDWAKNAKNALERGEDCNLDLKSDSLGEMDDGYETIQMPMPEIYSEKFTYVTSNVNPVISNPNIRLHPDKFLFPVLMRGPNNQLIGLRETIYVAIRLNRTLVIPRFIKHRTDSQLDGGNTIHPAHRVDFDTVCAFVSCVTIQQFREACGNQVDAILRLRYYSSKRIADMESFTGLRFSEVRNEQAKVFNFVPQPKEKKNKAETYFGPSAKEIKALFASQERCAMYALPYCNLKIKHKPSKRNFHSQADLEKLSDTEVFSEIIRHTPPPKYILNFSIEFVKELFGGAKFLTVHWRYDKKDWMKRCKTLDKDSKRKKKCNEAADTQPVDVARAILQKIKDLEPDFSGITHIYIASPPSETEFVKATKKILNAENLAVYYLEDLTKFLKQRYGSCNFLWEHTDDIESTIEMQICSKGLVFLRSSHSSWSSNVIEWRRHNTIIGTSPDRDEDIFLLTRKAKEDGSKKETRNSTA